MTYREIAKALLELQKRCKGTPCALCSFSSDKYGCYANATPEDYNTAWLERIAEKGDRADDYD